MKNKIIFGLIGKLACGKTSIAKYLEKNYQGQTFAFSGPLRDTLKRFYLPDTRENMQNLSQILREGISQDILAVVLAEDAKNSTHPMVCVDGVRRPKDIEYLVKLPDFYLINVLAGQKLRYERIIKRGQNPGEDTITFEQFQKNEAAEAESLIDEVAKSANFTVTNEGTIEELYLQIEKIINQLK